MPSGSGIRLTLRHLRAFFRRRSAASGSTRSTWRGNHGPHLVPPGPGGRVVDCPLDQCPPGARFKAEGGCGDLPDLREVDAALRQRGQQHRQVGHHIHRHIHHRRRRTRRPDHRTRHLRRRRIHDHPIRIGTQLGLHEHLVERLQLLGVAVPDHRLGGFRPLQRILVGEHLLQDRDYRFVHDHTVRTANHSDQEERGG